MRTKHSSAWYRSEMEIYSLMQDYPAVQESILRYTIARCREFRRPWKKKEWLLKVKRCHKSWQEGRKFARKMKELDEKWKAIKYT